LYGTGDARVTQPVFVVIFSGSPDAVLLVVETGMLICPPEGQNAHIEARVSARGGISEAQIDDLMFFDRLTTTEQITLLMMCEDYIYIYFPPIMA
jgi:hypothetical protein